MQIAYTQAYQIAGIGAPVSSCFFRARNWYPTCFSWYRNSLLSVDIKHSSVNPTERAPFVDRTHRRVGEDRDLPIKGGYFKPKIEPSAIRQNTVHHFSEHFALFRSREIPRPHKNGWPADWLLLP